MAASDSTRVILITGSNQGMGYHVAEFLAKQDGYHIIIAARNAERIEEARQKAIAAGAPAENLSVVKLELTSDEDIANAVTFVKEKFGRLDMLVNNGAMHGVESFEDDTIPNRALMLEVFNVNAASVAMITEAFKDLLLAAPAPYVWNVSSLLGSFHSATDKNYGAYGYPYFHYPVSKTAMNMVTVMHAKRWAETKIKVNMYAPDYTPTAMNGHTGWATMETSVKQYTDVILNGSDATGRFFTFESDNHPW